MFGYLIKTSLIGISYSIANYTMKYTVENLTSKLKSRVADYILDKSSCFVYSYLRRPDLN